MNAPERNSSYVLDDGEQKLVYEADTRIDNAGNFVINKEDHTLGHLLATNLLKNDRVKFAAYQKPHPLKTHIELKLQTDGNKHPPLKVMLEATKSLQNKIDEVEEMIEEQIKYEEDEIADKKYTEKELACIANLN